jgi:hypothetical protein
MNNIDDGGPAFPNLGYNAEEIFNGMTLRDWFAGQALAGLCANSELFKSFAGLRPEFLKHMSVDECDRFEHRVISMSAKSIADAMLAARKESK